MVSLVNALYTKCKELFLTDCRFIKNRDFKSVVEIAKREPCTVKYHS